eukprot:249894-Chlamydomonas_euryale.AAC.1
MIKGLGRGGGPVEGWACERGGGPVDGWGVRERRGPSGGLGDARELVACWVACVATYVELG